MFTCYNSGMKIITLLSQKGGSGKTTLALALAVHATAQESASLVVDLDPQSSAAYWAERRDEDSPVVIPTQAQALPRILEAARNNDGDLVLIDTAPHSESVALKAVAPADIVLIPCRASIHDIDAIENSVNIAQLQRKEACVVLNAVPPNAPNLIADVAKAIQNTYDVSVLPIAIAQRSDFVHSATVGKSPSDYAPDGKAAAEIRALYNHLMGVTEQSLEFAHS